MKSDEAFDLLLSPLPCFPPMNLTHEIINDKGVDHLFIVGLENLNTNTLICVVI